MDSSHFEGHFVLAYLEHLHFYSFKKNAVLKKFESDCHVKMASFISIIIIKKNETKKKDASPVGGITS